MRRGWDERVSTGDGRSAMLDAMSRETVNVSTRRKSGVWTNAWRLAGHDALVARKGFAATFSGWRDRALLIVILALGALWLRDAASRANAFDDPRVAAAAGAILGWMVLRGLRRRLAHHAAEGVLAMDALDRDRSLLYLAVGAAAPAFALIALGAMLVPAAVPTLAFGFGAGALTACLAPPRPAGRLSAPARGRLAMPPRPRIPEMAAAPALALASAALGRATLAWRGDSQAALVLAACTLLSLAWLARIDFATCRFLAMAGHGPARSAAAQLAPAALFWLLCSAFAWLLVGPAGVVAVSLVGAGLIAIATARVWLYQLHARRAADWLLTLALAVLALLGLAAPPLAPLLILLLGAGLYRRAAGATWMMR